MSPVNQTNLISEISSHYVFPSVKILLCSFEYAGQPGYQDLCNRVEFLPWEHFRLVTKIKKVALQEGGPDSIMLHCLLYFPHKWHERHKRQNICTYCTRYVTLQLNNILFIFLFSRQ